MFRRTTSRAHGDVYLSSALVGCHIASQFEGSTSERTEQLRHDEERAATPLREGQREALYSPSNFSRDQSLANSAPRYSTVMYGLTVSSTLSRSGPTKLSEKREDDKEIILSSSSFLRSSWLLPPGALRAVDAPSAADCSCKRKEMHERH